MDMYDLRVSILRAGVSRMRLSHVVRVMAMKYRSDLWLVTNTTLCHPLRGCQKIVCCACWPARSPCTATMIWRASHCHRSGPTHHRCFVPVRLPSSPLHHLVLLHCPLLIAAPSPHPPALPPAHRWSITSFDWMLKMTEMTTPHHHCSPLLAPVELAQGVEKHCLQVLNFQLDLLFPKVTISNVVRKQIMHSIKSKIIWSSKQTYRCASWVLATAGCIFWFWDILYNL
jgi:hypothetical protein